MKTAILRAAILFCFLNSVQALNAQTPVTVTNTPMPVTIVTPAPPAPVDKNTLDGLNLKIVSADFKSGIWTFSGYLPGSAALSTHTLQLKYYDVYGDWEWSPKISFTIVTVPFKIRNAIDTFPQTVQASLTNIGLAVNCFNRKLVRYLPNGTKSTHKFGAGVIFAPSFEDLTPANTKNFVNKNSKQLFISTSLNFNYTYNDISFFVVPLGLDFATTKDGKNYVYNKKPWWGFGIGLSTKFLGIRQ